MKNLYLYNQHIKNDIFRYFYLKDDDDDEASPFDLDLATLESSLDFLSSFEAFELEDILNFYSVK